MLYVVKIIVLYKISSRSIPKRLILFLARNCWARILLYITILTILSATWWRHKIETFSALLAICAGNSGSPVNSPHKGQWRGALMFSVICAWINGWINNCEAGDLRRLCTHYDVIVMCSESYGCNGACWLLRYDSSCIYFPNRRPRRDQPNLASGCKFHFQIGHFCFHPLLYRQ